jgi:hypothetical protein
MWERLLRGVIMWETLLRAGLWRLPTPGLPVGVSVWMIFCLGQGLVPFPTFSDAAGDEVILYFLFVIQWGILVFNFGADIGVSVF